MIAGCDIGNDLGNENPPADNTDPKSLTISGIDAEMKLLAEDDIAVGVFRKGTTVAQALSYYGVVAGAGDVDISEDGTSFKAEMDLYEYVSEEEWTGSGYYDVYIILGEDEVVYTKKNVSFDSTSTKVKIGDFILIEPEEPKTVTIINMDGDTAILASYSVFIGIFPKGTELEAALAQTNMVAGAEDFPEISYLAPYSTTPIDLYAAPIDSDFPWADSGEYDVFLIFDGSTVYTQEDVSFDEDAVTLDMEDFTAVTLDDIEPTTITITGFLPDFNEAEVEIGLVDSNLQEVAFAESVVSGGSAYFEFMVNDNIPFAGTGNYYIEMYITTNEDSFIYVYTNGAPFFTSTADAKLCNIIRETEILFSKFGTEPPPTSLKITNLTSAQVELADRGCFIGVFESGTTIAEALESTAVLMMDIGEYPADFIAVAESADEVNADNFIASSFYDSDEEQWSSSTSESRTVFILLGDMTGAMDEAVHILGIGGNLAQALDTFSEVKCYQFNKSFTFGENTNGIGTDKTVELLDALADFLMSN
jgi:hypothetical protein